MSIRPACSSQASETRLLLRGRGNDREAQQKNYQRDESPEFPRGVVRSPTIEQRRMPEAEGQPHQRNAPQAPAVPLVNSHSNQNDSDEQGDALVTLRAQAVDYVAAIELPGRQQVQRGGKEADPGGPADRRQQQRGGIRAGMKQFDENAHQRRIAKNDSGIGLSAWNNLGSRDGVGHQRNRDHESGDGPGDANIEKRAAGGDGRANAQESAEGSEQGRRRNEIRIADIDAVILAGEIVAELMH